MHLLAGFLHAMTPVLLLFECQIMQRASMLEVQKSILKPCCSDGMVTQKESGDGHSHFVEPSLRMSEAASV